MSQANARSRIVDRWWVPFLQIGCVSAAAAAWYLSPHLGKWALVLALAPWLIRLVLTGRTTRRTPFDLFLGIFIITAVVSVWVAYDRDGSLAVFPTAPVGWRKLEGLILATLLFYALAALETEGQRLWMIRLLAGLGAAVAIWFIAGNDWAAYPAELGGVTRLGQTIQAYLPLSFDHHVNANVVGGLTAIMLPASWETIIRAWREKQRGRWWWIAWGVATGLVMGLGLLLTTSWGAWLGTLGAGALAMAWWLAGRLGRSKRRVAVFAGLVALAIGVLVLAVVGIPALRARVMASSSLGSRLALYSQAALLIRDYPFTGCGLGNFALVHSTYALLIHVPILPHAHSLFIDVAVEQGLFGVLAAVGVLGWSGWLGLRTLAASGKGPAVLTVGLLSAAVLVIQGMFDDVPYGGSRLGLLFLWVPVGLIAAGLRGRKADASAARRRRWPAIGVAVGLGLVTLAVFGRALTAAWYANRGTVAQTLVELRPYDYNHFDDPSLDQIRRREDLSAAEVSFNRALALDPGQVTARTRLAQIALARGEYDEALAHAQAAWDADHRDRVTRLLLGDALVAHGRIEEAADIVEGLARADERLEGQAWYRYWLGEDWRRAAYAWRAILILDPDNARARQRAEQAEAKARSSE
jgi:O-antigen ligase